MLDELVKPGVQAFIKEHEKSDLNRLLLNKDKYPGIPVDLVVDQIEARFKAKNKLPLWFATEGVLMPPLLSMEQCSSEETARYKSELLKGGVCIDLTGGAGVDTFFLSKHFDNVHYVEQNKVMAEIAQHNFRKLGAYNIEVHVQKSEHFLSSFKASADLIYIDPARRDQQNKVFRFESCSPNILPLQEPLLAIARHVLLKASPMLDITKGVSQLKNVKEVHVVAVKNEVKELLFLQARIADDILVRAIDLAVPETFEFTLGDYVEPLIGEAGEYLYEPNAAILKSGGQNLLLKRFPVKKIHENTHLFTSGALIDGFPGRSFRIESITKYNKNEVRNAIAGSQANVAVRNFPDTVDAFRKKTGLKEGGEDYIFGYRNHKNNPEVAICKKALQS